LRESKAQLDSAYREIIAINERYGFRVFYEKIYEDLDVTATILNHLKKMKRDLIPVSGIQLFGSHRRALQAIGLLQRDPEEWFKGLRHHKTCSCDPWSQRFVSHHSLRFSGKLAPWIPRTGSWDDET